jgi:putative inorganic carbon (HCO3(-)) transporter
MDLAFRMIVDNPVLGLGANNFAASMNQYLTIDFSQEWIFTVHNKYLLVWAETGILGLVAFLWIMVAAIRRGWAAVRAHDRVLSPLALGLTTGIVANMIHMTVDIFHSRTQIQMLWIVMALMLAIASMTTARSKRASTLTRAAHR